MLLSNNQANQGPKINRETQFYRKPDQLFSEIDDEIVMLSVENEEYYSLNSIGKEIWDNLTVPISFAALIDNLVATFNVTPIECEKDITPYLIELLSHGLIIKK